MRKKLVLAWLSLASLSLACASPLAAQRSDPPPLPAEQPALPVLGQLAQVRDPGQRLALLDRALTMLLQPTPLRGAVLCTRAVTLNALNRAAEAREAFEQCRQLRPDDPHVLLFMGFAEAERNRPVEATRLIMRATTLDPEVVRDVDSGTMETVLRQLRYQRQDALADQLVERLATSGYARLDPTTFSGLTLVAVRHRVEAGEVDRAVQLLPAILSPDVGVRLLIDRRFAPIWPMVERWAGGDLSVQRRALRDSARAAWALARTPAHRLAYAGALTDTGRRGEAIALLDRWLATSPAPEEDRWWRTMATVKLGRWLAAEGRPDQGIARMQAALDGPLGKEPSAANITPNLAIQLVLAGRAADALALLDRRTPAADAVESPAALGYFVALRACALEGTGRHDEARALLERVGTVYASATAALAMATGCVASPDERARAWIARAADPQTRGDTLMQFAAARYRRPRLHVMDTLEEAALRPLLDRDDVQRAYARWARPLPAGYEPALDDFIGVPESGSTPVEPDEPVPQPRA